MIQEHFDTMKIQVTEREQIRDEESQALIDAAVILTFEAGINLPNGLTLPAKLYVTAIDPKQAIAFGEGVADSARKLLAESNGDAGKLEVVRDPAAARAAAEAAEKVEQLRKN